MQQGSRVRETTLGPWRILQFSWTVVERRRHDYSECASFCNESEDIGTSLEPNRSQQGYICALAPPDFLNADQAVIHPITWSSTLIRRVCRSTLMAETFAMAKGTEQGARLRAAIVDCKGKLNMSQWEDSSAQHMSHVWVTDCDSLYEHLIAEKANHVDNKRLAIDLLAMRQLIWERGGERTEIVDSSCGDYPRWIDTSTMIADPLIKAMSCDRTVATFETGVFDMRPTEEA